MVLFAGMIMAAVFLAFTTTPDVISKMMGLGLGLAIMIDVVIVRLVIAPAVVTPLGDRAWWLPGWLDKLMPNVALGGHLEPRPAGGRARAGGRGGVVRRRGWDSNPRNPSEAHCFSRAAR